MTEISLWHWGILLWLPLATKKAPPATKKAIATLTGVMTPDFRSKTVTITLLTGQNQFLVTNHSAIVTGTPVKAIFKSLSPIRHSPGGTLLKPALSSLHAPLSH
jgi:hypothetical protein